MSYQKFIESKKIKPVISGFDVNPESLNHNLMPFQRAIVTWALKRGRAALFEDTGLGKSLQQISWADAVHKHTNGDVIIFAPLCVAQQTIREGEKFGVHGINYCRSQDGVKHGINISNYEMLDKFDLSLFAGVVLDESSIIKNRDGKTRNAIIDACQSVKYRLSCTATPSPNDFMELGNQAEFLGVMKMTEMLATYFINDASDTGTWILKGHGKVKFWEWMATWAVCIRSPDDLGFDGSSYELPPMNMVSHVVESTATFGLFADVAAGLLERNHARRESIDDRVAKCAEVVNATDEQFFIWAHLNDECAMLQKMIPGSVNVSGSDSIEHKEKTVTDFLDGSVRVVISKAKILGSGMNFQCCHNTAFVGLSDSWEAYYQAIRRFYRFGQKEIVNVHVISAESEGAVVENIRRKELQHQEMSEQMVKHMAGFMKQEIFGATMEKTTCVREVFKNDEFELHLADCVDLAKEIKTDSIGYTIFSPPFSSLFCFSNSHEDMSNSRSHDEFYKHFSFLVDEMLRITQPGRLLSFHVMNLTTSKVNDGFTGIIDFRGKMIELFVKAGWIFHSEVTIWKCPVIAVTRTKAQGLLHKTVRKDSAMSRQGLADYLVTMRKPGINEVPIRHYRDEKELLEVCKTEELNPQDEEINIFPVDLWTHYASPVWMDINPTRTLQFRSGKNEDDIKHISPTQLDVIERAMHLWSAPGDLVFSPFAGIGTEGYVALQTGRKFIGSELKKSYWELACKNIREVHKGTADLFAE
jgi:hypothetical protein